MKYALAVNKKIAVNMRTREAVAFKKEYPLKSKEAMPLVSCMGTLPQKQEDKSFFFCNNIKDYYKLALSFFFFFISF